ncbi:hypothetical protein scyTo_0021186, partial [Scyliorhinus torazame]|nr:hypothetical protein [Scyliorhinus torazame]
VAFCVSLEDDQDLEAATQTEAAEPKDTEAGKKEPKRRIHFSSGETMEEYSTEEEFEEEQKVLETVNPSTLPWSHFLLFWMMKFARTSLFTCDFLGEKLANLFGLTSAKYQYAVDEYYSVQDQVTYNYQINSAFYYISFVKQGGIIRFIMGCLS